MYRIELVWNREFNWIPYGNTYDTLKDVKSFAIAIRNSGDGTRVKKIRVLDSSDKVIWNG